jgi:hypothetical protein
MLPLFKIDINIQVHHITDGIKVKGYMSHKNMDVKKDKAFQSLRGRAKKGHRHCDAAIVTPCNKSNQSSAISA